MYEVKPLYRKVNTRARHVHHVYGKSYKRNIKNKNHTTEAMVKVQRGLDYTPLFRFLISKVGQDWDQVHSEAITRLDKPEPIFWMVAVKETDQRPYFWCGDRSMYSGLYVDQDNVLQIVDPTVNASNVTPTCYCCTHTFNGIPLTKECPY